MGENMTTVRPRPMPRVGVIMWPTEPWERASALWRHAEELGFATAVVYDHTAWRGTTPWYDAYTTLAAAAAVTSRIRLGTLVTSPNFRHPVPTAHAVRSIDEISAGRLHLGIGAGGASRTSDGGILGGPDWSPRERADRFEEWVDLLDRLLRGPVTTYTGEHWSAREVNTAPGCVQRPRVPFAIAGDGPRGRRLAVRHADTWITVGREGDDGRSAYETVRSRLAALDRTCAEEGREPTDLRRLLTTGFSAEPWLESVAAFEDLAGRYAEIGITDIAVHWPRADSPWDADLRVIEAIAAATA